MQQRIITLDVMRMVILLGIICFHAKVNLFGGGEQLTSFFYVVAGYLFTINGRSYKEYLLHVLKKNYFPYLFCLLLCVVFTQHFDWKIIPHSLLLQSFVPLPEYGVYHFTYQYLKASWFLSSLVLCYVLAFQLDKQLNKVDTWLAAFIVLMVLFAMTRVLTTKQYGYWLTYICPVTRLLEFSLGMMLRISAPPSLKMFKSSVFGVLIYVLIIALYLSLLHWHLPQHVCTLLHLGIIYFLTNYYCKPIIKLFDNFIFNFLSRYFLFIYLVHEELLYYLGDCVHNQVLRITLSIAISICIGFIFNVMQKWLLRIIDGKQMRA